MATQQKIGVPLWHSATDKGEITHKGGHHEPKISVCGCKGTTKSGYAYRDVTVELPDGRTAYFYHQSAVVVEKDGVYRIDSHGYRTSTTKERINRYLPSGWYVRQRDFTWYLKNPDGEVVKFEDGMQIEEN